MSRNKKELLIIGGMLLLSLLLVWVFRGLYTGDQVKITYDGEPYGTYPIKVDRQILIETEYGTNLVIIENGTARMESADCPDKICVQMYPISPSDPGVIVCLPHRIIVEILSEP